MKKTWALVANSSYAIIYEVKNMGKEITIVERIPFPDGRKKASELNTDKPGRIFDSFGGARHAASNRVDPHTHEQQIFAAMLCHYLHKARAENKFEELAIIAPPQFYGELHPHFSDSVRPCVIKHVTKDLPERLSDSERLEYLVKYLDLWNT